MDRKEFVEEFSQKIRTRFGQYLETLGYKLIFEEYAEKYKHYQISFLRSNQIIGIDLMLHQLDSPASAEIFFSLGRKPIVSSLRFKSVPLSLYKRNREKSSQLTPYWVTKSNNSSEYLDSEELNRLVDLMLNDLTTYGESYLRGDMKAFKQMRKELWGLSLRDRSGSFINILKHLAEKRTTVSANMTGVWVGKYSFDSRDPIAKFYPSIPFTVIIKQIRFGKFLGEIKDDPTIGLPEWGRVRGRVFASKVSFVKLTPVFYIFLPRGKISFNDYCKEKYNLVLDETVHSPPTRYKGQISPDGKKVSGVWELGPTTIRYVFQGKALASKLPRASGTWEMRRQ